MSAAPFVVRNVRFGTTLGAKINFEDMMTASSLDTYCNFTMPQTAENLAEKYELKRSEVDEFALESQRRWKAGKLYFFRMISAIKHQVCPFSSFHSILRVEGEIGRL